MFELCPCPHGTLHLGRMLRGLDSGRLVVLREVATLSPPLLAAVDLGRSLAHPQLLKSLGVVHSTSCSYLANEYLPGITLLELEAAVRTSRFPLRPSVAVRIIKDALRAAGATQRLLNDTAGLSYTRCLFADTVWIAEFGDVLLTDVPVAPLLAKVQEADPALRAAKDLLAAAIHLFQLASGETLSPSITQKIAAYVPERLAETLARALGVSGSTPFASITEFVEALDALPNELQAEAHEVTEEVQRRVGSSLSQRRNKLGLLELGAAAAQDADEVTRVFRSLTPERSALESAPLSPNQGSAGMPEVPRLSGAALGASWKEEPTRVDRLPPGIAALARIEQRDARPVSAKPAAAALRTVASARRRPGNPKFFWLACLGLVATLAVVWWAMTGKSRATPRPRDSALGVSS